MTQLHEDRQLTAGRPHRRSADRRVLDRQHSAMRLLVSSAHNSFDPAEDLDWDAPLEPDKPCMPWHRVSLFGTDLWADLNRQQQVELSKHEMASIMQVGLWFEIILMQMLLRYSYDLDLRDPHAQYAMTEVGDETRHSIMFARCASKLGVPHYGAPRLVHELGRIYKATAGGPAMFAPVLVAEEVTDRLQREIMVDEQVQPLVRGISKIHVVEESRHVRYAREELLRLMPRLSRAALARQRLAVATVSYCIVDSLIDRRVYEAVGIPADVGRRAALSNPHHRQTRRWMAEKIMPFLQQAGIVGGPSSRLYRKGFLL
ncbi:MAG TPA: diiron oxygenase [Jatrophihabitans sp.]|nr:diiron oxygenase [Jatrophihabitans sp.]